MGFAGIMISFIVEMMSHCTVATYVKIGFNVGPCSHVISSLIMVSAGHQGIADSGTNMMKMAFSGCRQCAMRA
jgi:hypothetical protein